MEYLSGLIRAGITPMVIMDGMQDREKETTTLLRRHAQVVFSVKACTSQGHIPRARYCYRSLCLAFPQIAADSSYSKDSLASPVSASIYCVCMTDAADRAASPIFFSR